MLRSLFCLLIMASLLMSAQESSIKVGVLIPDSSRREVILACKLAITQAERIEGRPCMPVEMVVRTTEGPWGAGSGASVDLIYEDSVVALLCSLDGRNAHLAEQVTAKTHIACIETSATDPTLTQAYVPWFLRCLPSDDQQAMAIMQQMLVKGDGLCAILCSGDYDSRMSAHSFIKILAREGKSGPLILEMEEGEPGIRQLATMIRGKGIRHLVLPFYSASTGKLIALLRKDMPELNIYGTHAFFATYRQAYADMQSLEGIYLVSTLFPLSTKGEHFTRRFQEKYGRPPGVSAAYAYDGMSLILQAIHKVGSDPDLIRKYLGGIRYEDGSTGSISFDELGNRKDAARIIRIVDGVPSLPD